MFLIALVSVVAGGSWALQGGRDDAAEGVPPAAGALIGARDGESDMPAAGRAAGEASPTETRSDAAAPIGESAAAVRYTFDGGIGTQIMDGAGRLPLKIRQAGGSLAAVPHAGGLAVRFPARCEHYGAESCARAILQSGPAGFLNPGQSAFTYGASVLVKPSETSKGANVMQKGFAVGDSQFKLQVDGQAGRPSCVIVGTSGPAIYVALASQSVADGRWHKVECARAGAQLTVAVDGQVKGRSAIPPSLSIVNADPLCIGGKGTSPNNDQFTGAIDDVFVTKAT